MAAAQSDPVGFVRRIDCAVMTRFSKLWACWYHSALNRCKQRQEFLFAYGQGAGGPRGDQLAVSLCVGNRLNLQPLAGLKQVVRDGVKQIGWIVLRQVTADSLNDSGCLLDQLVN